MSIIANEFEEELTHEGVMDIFKSKNVEVSERTIILLDTLNLDGEQTNFYDDIDDFINSSTLKADGINRFINSKSSKFKEYDGLYQKFLSGPKRTYTINNKSNINNKVHIKNVDIKYIFNTVKKMIKSGSKARVFFNRTLHNLKLLNDMVKNEILEKHLQMIDKVISELNIDNKLVDKKVTVESAISDLKIVMDLEKTIKSESDKNMLLEHYNNITNQSLTTESGIDFKTDSLSKLNELKDKIIETLITTESAVDKNKLNKFINKLKQVTDKSIQGFLKEYNYEKIPKEDIRKVTTSFNITNIKVNDLINHDEVDFDIIKIDYSKLGIGNESEIFELRKYINGSIILNEVLDFSEEDNEDFSLQVYHKADVDTKSKTIYFSANISN